MNTILIDTDACKGCYLCVEVCPKSVLAPSRNRNSKGYSLPVIARAEKCTGCRNCELICPELAIEVSTDAAA